MERNSDAFRKIQNQVNSPAVNYDEQFKPTSVERTIDPTIFQKFEPTSSPQAKVIPGFEMDDYTNQLGDMFSPYRDIDEERAQAQSNANKLLIKFPARIGAKVVEEVAKIPGELAGIGMWATEGFDPAKFEESVNNEWVKAISEYAQEFKDEKLPVYTRRVVEEGGLMRQIVSPEFWAKEGADGIGFLVSMFGPGFATKALKIPKMVSGGAKALGLNAKASIKIGKYADDIVAGGVNTLVEAAAEGIEAAEGTKQALYQKKLQELTATGQYDPGQAADLATQYLNTDEAKAIIGKAGANTVAANMVLLLGPNILDQKWLFGGFNQAGKTASKINNKLFQSVNALGQEGAEQAGKFTTKQLAKEGLKKAAIGIGKEGFFEEGLQFASSDYFKNRALGTDDRDIVGGILGTYAESLKDIDMQKSIFLGGVLGGGMGSIGAVRSNKLEDKLLYGDSKKGTIGLAKLFENNFVNRYKSISDLTLKDEENNVVYNSDGTPKIDIAKAKSWGTSVINDEVNKKLLDYYNSMGLTNPFDFAKMVHDFNYMMPFFQQEGGKDMLVQHINNLAEKDAAYLKETLGIEPSTVQDTKAELLKKADQYEEIYYNVAQFHKLPNLEIDNKDIESFKEFNNLILDTKISNELSQTFVRDKMEEAKSEISKLESIDTKTDAEISKLNKLQKAYDNFAENLTALREENKKLNNKQELKDSWEEYSGKIKKVKEDLLEEAATTADNPEEIKQAAKDSTPEEKSAVNTAINNRAKEEQVKQASFRKWKKTLTGFKTEADKFRGLYESEIATKNLDEVAEDYETTKNNLTELVANIQEYSKLGEVSLEDKKLFAQIHKNILLKLDVLKSALENPELQERQQKRDIYEKELEEILRNEAIELHESDDRIFIIRDKQYFNYAANAVDALNRGKDGEIVSVTLLDENLKQHTFTKQSIVDFISYNILLKEVAKYEQILEDKIDLVESAPQIQEIRKSTKDVQTNPKQETDIFKLHRLLDEAIEVREELDTLFKNKYREYMDLGFRKADVLADPELVEVQSQLKEVKQAITVLNREIKKLSKPSKKGIIKTQPKVKKVKVYENNIKESREEVITPNQTIVTEQAVESTSANIRSNIEAIQQQIQPIEEPAPVETVFQEKFEEAPAAFSQAKETLINKLEEITEEESEEIVAKVAEIRNLISELNDATTPQEVDEVLNEISEDTVIERVVDEVVEKLNTDNEPKVTKLIQQGIKQLENIQATHIIVEESQELGTTVDTEVSEINVSKTPSGVVLNQTLNSYKKENKKYSDILSPYVKTMVDNNGLNLVERANLKIGDKLTTLYDPTEMVWQDGGLKINSSLSDTYKKVWLISNGEKVGELYDQNQSNISNEIKQRVLNGEQVTLEVNSTWFEKDFAKLDKPVGDLRAIMTNNTPGNNLINLAYVAGDKYNKYINPSQYNYLKVPPTTGLGQIGFLIPRSSETTQFYSMTTKALETNKEDLNKVIDLLKGVDFIDGSTEAHENATKINEFIPISIIKGKDSVTGNILYSFIVDSITPAMSEKLSTPKNPNNPKQNAIKITRLTGAYEGKINVLVSDNIIQNLQPHQEGDLFFSQLKDGDLTDPRLVNEALLDWLGSMNYTLSSETLEKANARNLDAIDLIASRTTTNLHSMPLRNPNFSFVEVSNAVTTPVSESAQNASENTSFIADVEPEVKPQDVVDKIIENNQAIVENDFTETIEGQLSGLEDFVGDIEGLDISDLTDIEVFSKGVDNEIYKPWNEKEELAWLSKNLPNFAGNKLQWMALKQTLKGVPIHAYGKFKNGVIYLSKDAKEGTAQHEAFHAVFWTALNKSQRNTLIKEGAIKYGISDPELIEEAMADDFNTYRKYEDSSSLPAKIKAFFNRILGWIKSEIFNTLTIDYIYYKLNNGKFKNLEPDSNIKIERLSSRFFGTNLYEAADVLNESLMKMVNAVLANPKNTHLQGLSARDYLLLVDEDGKTNLDKFYGVATMYLISKLKDFKNAGADTSKIIVLENLIKEATVAKVGSKELLYGSVGILAKTKLTKLYGLSATSTRVYEADDVEYILDNNDEEEVKGELYSSTVKEQSGQMGLSAEMRLALSTIPTKDKDFLDLFPKRLQFDFAYAYLKHNLSDIPTKELMLDKLEELSKAVPDLKNFYNKVMADESLKSKLFVDFYKSTTPFMTVFQRKDGGIGVESSINTMADGLVSDWESNFYDNGWIEDSIVTDTARQKAEEFVANNKIQDAGYNEKFNTEFQLNLNPDTISSLESRYLGFIVSNLVDKINPFEKSKSVFRTIAKAESIYNMDSLESSFRRSDGKTIYGHLIPGFASKQIARLKHQFNETMAMYEGDAFYRNSPLFQDLKANTNNIREELAFGLISEIRMKGIKEGDVYVDFSDKQYLSFLVGAFQNNNSKTYAWYPAPVLSDSSEGMLFKLPKYADNNEVLNKLVQVVKQEYARINETTNVPEIKNYSKNKKKLHFIPLNLSDITKDGELVSNDKIKAKISEYLDNRFELYFAEIEKNELFNLDDLQVDKTFLQIDPYRVKKISPELKARIKEKFRNQFLNSTYAQTQIITMTTGDPAMYKSVTDFYKRSKEIASPTIQMDFKATYNNGTEVITPGVNYNTLFVKDHEIAGNIAKDFWDYYQETGDVSYAKLAAQYGYSNHTVTNKDGKKTDFVKIELGDSIQLFKTQLVNTADAQTFISPERYRKIMVGYQRWNKQFESTYNRIVNEQPLLPEDYDVTFQALKPFVFSHIKHISGKVIPTQNKNSEYMLTPQLIKASPTLKKIYDLMRDKKVDSISFTSVVKVGEYNAVSLQDILNGNIKPENIHSLKNADYGLQQETPEHHVDSEALFGSQIRKLILSNLDFEQMYNVEGQLISGKELYDEYHRLISKNIEESWDGVLEEIGDTVDGKFKISMSKLSDLLLGEVIKQGYGKDVETAVSLNADGRLNVHPSDPIIRDTVEKLLNAVFKNRITKQKIKGGSFIQTSGVGFSSELKIVMGKDSNGNPHIKEVECYLPWSSRKYFEPFMDAAGEIDIKQVPESLLKMIGYRIPTEDKYSMLPLKVKGFLPFQAGGSIMLPIEITTLAGSDFDVDKLYVMMPEFKVKSDEILKELYTIDDENLNNRYSTFIGKQLSKESKNEYFNEIKKKSDSTYGGYKGQLNIKGKKYGAALSDGYQGIFDFLESLDIKELSIDVKSYIKQYAGYELKLIEKIQLLDSYSSAKIREHSEYAEYLKESGESETKITKEKELAEGFSLLNSRISETLEQLKSIKKDKDEYALSISTKIAEKLWNDFAYNRAVKLASDFKLMDVSTFSKLPIEMQNTPEARNNRLIDIMYGVLTNSSTFKAAITPGGIGTFQTAANLVYLSKNGQDFNQLQSDLESGKISEEDLQEMVENKLAQEEAIGFSDPYSNMKVFRRNMSGKALVGIMANHSVAHAMLQFTNVELATPVIIGGQTYTKLNQTRDKNGNYISFGSWVAAATDNAKDPNAYKVNINTYTADVASLLNHLGVPIEEAFMLLSQPIVVELAERYFRNGATFDAEKKAIKELIEIVEKTGDKTTTTSVEDMIKGFDKGISGNTQLKMLTTFLQLKEQAQSLARFIAATKPDTKGIGPNSVNNELSIRAIRETLADEKLLNTKGVFKGDDYPMFKAFITYGLVKPTQLMEQILPLSNTNKNSIVDQIKVKLQASINKSKLNEKDLRKVNDTILSYLGQQIDFFKGDNNVKTFPETFKKLVTKELRNKFSVLKHVEYRKDAKFEYPRLEFKNLGGVTKVLKEDIKASWESMYKDSDPKIRQFALDLARYTFYKEGFIFGPKSFAHLIPVDLMLTYKDGDATAREQWYNILESNDITLREGDIDKIIDIFITNNWKNRAYAPAVAADKNIIVDGKNGIPGMVTANADSQLKKGNNFMRYISVPFNSGKDSVLMKLDRVNYGDNGFAYSAVYAPVPKKGSGGILFEMQEGLSILKDNNKFLSLPEKNKVVNSVQKVARNLESVTTSQSIESSENLFGYSDAWGKNNAFLKKSKEFIKSLDVEILATAHGNYSKHASSKTELLLNNSISVNELFNQDKPYYVLERFILDAGTAYPSIEPAAKYLIDVKNKKIIPAGKEGSIYIGNDDTIGFETVSIKELLKYDQNFGLSLPRYFNPELEKMVFGEIATPQVNKITFTPDQQIAFNLISDYLKSDKKEPFSLIGKAGTGKTTLIKSIIDEIGEGEKIVIAALSHKAKNVIYDGISTKKGLPDKVSVHTIASLLGMSLDLETGEFVQNSNKEDFSYSETPINDADIVIIDESSMINEEAMSLILENGPDKIIFMGDKGQLPPIRSINSYLEIAKSENKDVEKVSRIAETNKNSRNRKEKLKLLEEVEKIAAINGWNNYDSLTFNFKDNAKLTTRIRQGEESPILPYADNYWNNSSTAAPVLNPVNKEDRVSKLSSKGNLIFTDKKTAINKSIDEFKKVVSELKPNLIKVISYRNETRQNINEYIHNKLFGENSLEYNKGELLMFLDAYTASEKKGFQNSDEIQVLAAKPIKINTLLKYNEFDGYSLTAEVEESGSKKTYDIKVLSKKSKKLFDIYISGLFEEAAKMPKGRLRAQMYKDIYAEKSRIANLDYAYAITSHKSQGSTYNTVMILEDDIMSVAFSTQKAKSQAMYTAITRAKNNVMIVSSKNTENLEDFNIIEDKPVTLESQQKEVSLSITQEQLDNINKKLTEKGFKGQYTLERFNSLTKEQQDKLKECYG